jgi:cadmium resistance protein CadD (predicted permease)
MELLGTLGIVIAGISVALGLSYVSMEAILSLMPSRERRS